MKSIDKLREVSLLHGTLLKIQTVPSDSGIFLNFDFVDGFRYEEKDFTNDLASLESIRSLFNLSNDFVRKALNVNNQKVHTIYYNSFASSQQNSPLI